MLHKWYTNKAVKIKSSLKGIERLFPDIPVYFILPKNLEKNV